MDVSQLKRIPLFSGASDEELKKVATFAASRSSQRVRKILKEGSYSHDLFAIEDGTAEVTRDGEHIADLGPGDIFGEAGMLDDSMRSATVTASRLLGVITLGTSR